MTPAIFHNNLQQITGTLTVQDRKLIFSTHDGLCIIWDEYSILAAIIEGKIILRSTLEKELTISLSNTPANRVLISDQLGLEFKRNVDVFRLKNELFKTVTILSLFLIVVVGVLWTTRLFSVVFVPLVSMDMEIKFSKFLLNDTKILKLKTKSKEWKSLTEKLTSIDDRYPWRVEIIDSTHVNAFALPGGTILFTKKFIMEVESVDEILGVLAHEMAHVSQRHNIKYMLSNVSSKVTQFIFTSGLFSSAIYGLDKFGNLTYSRKQESEADIVGLKYLQVANISPQGLINFFNRNNSNSFPSSLRWFSSHPLNEDRIRMIQTLKLNGPYEQISFNLDALKNELKLIGD